MPDRAQSRNPFFPLAAFSAALFILTILALVASVFGDPHAPLAQLFDWYAGRLIAIEVAATLLTGFLALAVDRRQTLRELARAAEKGEAAGERATSEHDTSAQAPHDQQHQG